MILRPAKHRLLLSFDPEYETRYNTVKAQLVRLRKLRDEAARDLILKCYPFLLPLQLLIYFTASNTANKKISLLMTLSYCLGIFLFYLITEVIYTVKENRGAR